VLQHVVWQQLRRAAPAACVGQCEGPVNSKCVCAAVQCAQRRVPLPIGHGNCHTPYLSHPHYSGAFQNCSGQTTAGERRGLRTRQANCAAWIMSTP
jgi:hypothetical protein